MIETHESEQGSVIACLEVEPERDLELRLHRPDPDPRQPLRLRADRREAASWPRRRRTSPSSAATCSRRRSSRPSTTRRRGVGNEIQITDAIGLLNRTQKVTGYAFSEGRYDCGKPLDYLKATVEIGAMRDDLGPAFREFLKEFVATLD